MPREEVAGIEESLKTARRAAGAYKRHRGSLKGFAAHLVKNHMPLVSLHVDVDEDLGVLKWSGLSNWPEGWQNMPKFKKAWFNKPEPTYQELWDQMSDQARRFAARWSPDEYLAAGIDISPYLPEADSRELE